MDLNTKKLLFVVAFFSSCLTPAFAATDENSDSLRVFTFVKKENISGVIFIGTPEKEELRSDATFQNEELFTGSAKYILGSHSQNFLPYKQETLDFDFAAGFLAGRGTSTDSSALRIIEADNNIFGFRLNAAAKFDSRFYYDDKNYTHIGVKAWGRYDVFRRRANGTLLDSLQVSSDYDKTATGDKLRYGFQANAAWGIGRFNPVNHLMVAEYLLDNFYQRRNFSDKEVHQFAGEIVRIKHRRSPAMQRQTEQEVVELREFLKQKLMLKAPGGLEQVWQYGEFLPRFDGSRFEFGPFFNYFNREPDFVYGAFIKLENEKYIDYKQNRNFNLNLSYNRYKISDWLMLEAGAGYSFYRNLKSKVSVGLKYLPAMVVNDFTNLERVHHNFIPYLQYYSQVNSSTRIDFNFSWKVADSSRFMQSGPEFSLAIYRSNY